MNWTTKYDNFDRDFILQEWNNLKERLKVLKEQELEMRTYIVNRAFPEKHSGVNTLELGNGYQLKAKVAFHYNLADNDTVEKTLDKIAKIGNEGAFIAERLVSWKASFLLTEYNALLEAAKSSEVAQQILATIGEMLTITDAAPTLEVKEPKVKK